MTRGREGGTQQGSTGCCTGGANAGKAMMVEGSAASGRERSATGAWLADRQHAATAALCIRGLVCFADRNVCYLQRGQGGAEVQARCSNVQHRQPACYTKQPATTAAMNCAPFRQPYTPTLHSRLAVPGKRLCRPRRQASSQPTATACQPQQPLQPPHRQPGRTSLPLSSTPAGFSTSTVCVCLLLPAADCCSGCCMTCWYCCSSCSGVRRGGGSACCRGCCAVLGAGVTYEQTAHFTDCKRWARQAGGQ